MTVNFEALSKESCMQHLRVGHLVDFTAFEAI